MNKKDVQTIITDRIISALEGGTIPWRQTWKTHAAMNMVSKKYYRGLNALLLNSLCYGSPYWLTFKQCQSLGGRIKKGEKATPIVYWRRMEAIRTDPVTGEDKVKPYLLLRYYNVFNILQTEGIEKSDPVLKPLEYEAIVTGYKNPPSITYGDPAYSPSIDTVTVPPIVSFESPQAYYSTLYHELVHSTGHNSRLDRDQKHSFGTPEYAIEELIAEIGSSYLRGYAGLSAPDIEDTAAYIQSWLKALNDDKSLVFKAAKHAQKAVDHILGTEPESSETAE